MISKYFPDSPVEEHIYVLVSPPETTTTFGRGVRIKKATRHDAGITQQVCTVHAFDVVVSPRRTKSFRWTVNIEHATLEGLKNSICAMYPTPALENDGAELNMLSQIGLSAQSAGLDGETENPTMVLESSLSNRKRKANEAEEDQMVGKVFGIVADAENFILWNVR
ncbi:hypothetical protein C1646_752348 [Rhizophagus diaphanus]|nr:hypothetical protein C1646_752348 [Rhizophagus diaphanus] [Rhizophagus sp. MUCL 43196]